MNFLTQKVHDGRSNAFFKALVGWPLSIHVSLFYQGKAS
jgi:hypothetical protein